MPIYSDPLWTTAFLRVYDHYGGGGLEPRTAIEGSFSAWGGLGKPNRGLGRGETFFPDSDSDRDSDLDSNETFQISRKLGLEHVEFFCLLDSQPWLLQLKNLFLFSDEYDCQAP